MLARKSVHTPMRPCNTLAPGYIATEMVITVPKKVLDTKIIPLIPVGRLGTPEETRAPLP